MPPMLVYPLSVNISLANDCVPFPTVTVQGAVFIARYNPSEQIVILGHKAAAKLLEEAGYTRDGRRAPS